MKADAAEVRLYAADKKIYPRAVHGWFAAWRWLLVWGTQLVFYGGAWLTWNGRQAVLFDDTIALRLSDARKLKTQRVAADIDHRKMFEHWAVHISHGSGRMGRFCFPKVKYS